MKKTAILTILLSLFLVGCSTKREYFYVDDDNITADIDFSKSLSDDIDFVSYNAATLENGRVVAKYGIIDSNVTLGKDERLISVSQNKFIVSDISGNLRVLNEFGKEIYKRNLNRFVVAASIDGDDLALLTLGNIYYLIKMSSDTILLQDYSSPSIASYTNVANPVFAGPMIIYPTLDGKVAVVDRATNTLTQNMVISDELVFDTIIFLESTATNLYIATPNRLFMLSNGGNKAVRLDIKNIAIGENRIFVMQNDGVVKVFDMLLNEVGQNKFKFALFNGGIAKGDSFYMLEKNGYLIQTDLNLQNPRYYDIGGDISDKVFVGDDVFYHGNKALKID